MCPVWRTPGSPQDGPWTRLGPVPEIGAWPGPVRAPGPGQELRSLTLAARATPHPHHCANNSRTRCGSSRVSSLRMIDPRHRAAAIGPRDRARCGPLRAHRGVSPALVLPSPRGSVRSTSGPARPRLARGNRPTAVSALSLRAFPIPPTNRIFPAECSGWVLGTPAKPSTSSRCDERGCRAWPRALHRDCGDVPP